MNKTQIGLCYENWLNRTPGFTRSTMSRKEYTKMMKMFSEHGLKRNNFKLSTKNHDENSYRLAKANYMQRWRNQCFPRNLSSADCP